MIIVWSSISLTLLIAKRIAKNFILVKRNRFTVSLISDGAGETWRLWWREFLVKHNRLQSCQIGDGDIGEN